MDLGPVVASSVGRRSTPGISWIEGGPSDQKLKVCNIHMSWYMMFDMTVDAYMTPLYMAMTL
jgi:hypothetical protein